MRHSDTSRYEILFDLPAGEYNGAEVGGIRTKTIRAGDALEVECFPITKVGEAARREAQRRRTGPAQAALNRRNAAKRIQRLIDANYSTEDWVLTFTWDYSAVDKFSMSLRDMDETWEKLGLPVDEDEARAEFVKYLRRVKYRVRKRGATSSVSPSGCHLPGAYRPGLAENSAQCCFPGAAAPLKGKAGDGEMKYIYVEEATHLPRVGDRFAMPPHYHFHAVLHAPGMTAEEIKALWPWGDVRCDRLSMRGDGSARLAGYLSKHLERDEPGKAKVGRWACSKNHVEPTITVSNRKVSRRRAALVAEDVRQYGQQIFEALYPGYQCMAEPVVRYSEFVAGAYIYARLRKIDSGQPWERAGRKGGRFYARP